MGKSKFAPVFAQVFLSLLRIGKSSLTLSKATRASSIKALGILLETTASTRPETLAHVFPGVATQLGEIVGAAFRAGRTVRVEAFRALATLYVYATPFLPKERQEDVERMTEAIVRSTEGCESPDVRIARCAFADDVLRASEPSERVAECLVFVMANDATHKDVRLSAFAETALNALKTERPEVVRRAAAETALVRACGNVCEKPSTTKSQLITIDSALSLADALPYDALDALVDALAAALQFDYDFSLLHQGTYAVRYERIDDDEFVSSALKRLEARSELGGVLERCFDGRIADNGVALRIMVLASPYASRESKAECVEFATATLRDSDRTRRVVETALDVLGRCVSSNELINVLYDVLRFDAEPHVARADDALERIASREGYANRTDLLRRNLDYFVDDLCHQLRHDVVSPADDSCAVAASLFAAFPLSISVEADESFGLIRDVLDTGVEEFRRPLVFRIQNVRSFEGPHRRRRRSRRRTSVRSWRAKKKKKKFYVDERVPY